MNQDVRGGEQVESIGPRPFTPQPHPIRQPQSPDEVDQVRVLGALPHNPVLRLGHGCQ